MSSIRLPGELNSDFAVAVTAYISQFHCSVTLDRKRIDRVEFYAWCAEHLGEKYRDWFIYEGGVQDNFWCLHIRSPKKATFVRLKYNDIIVSSHNLGDNNEV